MVRFKSQATGDLVMVQAHADAVLKLLGKSAIGPGILETQDMPAALTVLKGASEQKHPPEHGQPADLSIEGLEPEQAEPGFMDENVSLRQRAWPLAQMIERSMEANKPIVWGV